MKPWNLGKGVMPKSRSLEWGTFTTEEYVKRSYLFLRYHLFDEGGIYP